MTPPIRLDDNADALVLPAALDAFMRASALYGDPRAEHARGREARHALEQALARIAARLGVAAEQLIVTSGGTEADALALLAVSASPGERPHVVTTTVEHAAIGATLEALERDGRVSVTRVPVGRDGAVRSADVLAALRPATRLASVVAASNETGVLQPLHELGPALRARGVLLHTDAVQLLGRVALRSLAELGADSVALSAHKLGAVGGVGLLVTAPGFSPEPLLPHDDVAGVCSLAAALEALPGPEQIAAVAARRDRFEAGLQARLAGLEILGASRPRLANTSCVRFAGCEGDAIMMALDLEGIAVSTGSACSSGSIEPSKILLGMGLSKAEARQTVRFSASAGTSDDDVARALDATVRIVERIRALA